MNELKAVIFTILGIVIKYALDFYKSKRDLAFNSKNRVQYIFQLLEESINDVNTQVKNLNECLLNIYANNFLEMSNLRLRPYAPIELLSDAIAKEEYFTAYLSLVERKIIKKRLFTDLRENCLSLKTHISSYYLYDQKIRDIVIAKTEAFNESIDQFYSNIRKTNTPALKNIIDSYEQRPDKNLIVVKVKHLISPILDISTPEVEKLIAAYIPKHTLMVKNIRQDLRTYYIYMEQVKNSIILVNGWQMKIYEELSHPTIKRLFFVG